MVHRIILPKLGTNVEKAKIISWLKKEGEEVLKGEIILVVETDKATFELGAEHGGILRKILYPEGSVVIITRTIAIISELDEDISELEKQVREEEKESVDQLYAKQTWKEWFEGKDRLKPEAERSKIRMSPAARKMAKEKGVDIQFLSKHLPVEKKVIELQDMKHFAEPEKLVIYGAGLGAKQALEIISQFQNIEVVGLIDDNKQIKNRIIHGYKVFGGFDYINKAFIKGMFTSVVLSFHSEVRRKIFLKLKEEIPKISIKTLIDPRTIVSADVEIGEGVFIEAGSVLGPGVKIGNGTIIDLGAVVCHDCNIGEYSHLSPGCCLSGIVCLKENVLVGAGASINSTVTVGENVIITPGSAVMNDVEDNVIVSGIPAVIIGESKRG